MFVGGALLLHPLALPGMLTCRMGRQPTLAKRAPCPGLPRLPPAHLFCTSAATPRRGAAVRPGGDTFREPLLPALSVLFALLHLPRRRSTARPACPTSRPGRTCKSCALAACTHPTSTQSSKPSWLRLPACAAWHSATTFTARSTRMRHADRSRIVWRCVGRPVVGGWWGCWACWAWKDSAGLGVRFWGGCCYLHCTSAIGAVCLLAISRACAD